MSSKQASSLATSLLRRSCAQSSVISTAPRINSTSFSRSFVGQQLSTQSRTLHGATSWNSAHQVREKQTCQRWYSTEPKPSKLYNFEDIQTLSSTPKPHPSKILVDVREPSELTSTGTIPHAINIPVSSSPEALFLPADEFEDKFGFEKPETGETAPELIFFCKAGVRSRAAAELARQAGYGNVGEYGGSWLDWERNGGKKVPWHDVS